MRARRVTAADGSEWRVGRRWLGRPWPKARWPWRRATAVSAQLAAGNLDPIPLDAPRLY